MPHDSKIADVTNRLARFSADQGNLIEMGWEGYKLGVVPPNAPEIQHSECRLAFYAGAMHLFSSIMMIMDEDAEPTAADLHKVEQINRELEDFAAVLERRIANIAQVKGRA